MAKSRKRRGQHLARGVDDVRRTPMHKIRKAVEQDQRSNNTLKGNSNG